MPNLNKECIFINHMFRDMCPKLCGALAKQLKYRLLFGMPAMKNVSKIMHSVLRSAPSPPLSTWWTLTSLTWQTSSDQKLAVGWPGNKATVCVMIVHRMQRHHRYFRSLPLRNMTPIPCCSSQPSSVKVSSRSVPTNACQLWKGGLHSTLCVAGWTSVWSLLLT